VAQLIVRSVEDNLVRRLKLRAARNGRSAEAEHREILRLALLESETRTPFKSFLEELPADVPDEVLERTPDRGREVDF